MRANCTVDLDLECWRILGHIIAAGGGGETRWTFYCMLCCIVVLQSSGQLDTPKKYHCRESRDRQIWTKADRPPYSALNGHLPQLLISDSRGFSHQIRFLENLWRPGRSHQHISALLCTIRFQDYVDPRIFNERTLLVAYYRVSKCFSTKLTVLLQSVFWHAPFTQNWGSRQKKSESVCYFATTSHRWRRCGRKKTLWYSMILNSDPM